MKKLFFLSALLAAMNIVNAQPVKPTVSKTTIPMKTMLDSASYAVGLSVINFYKQQGITKLNSSMVIKAMNDVLTGKKPLLDDAASNTVLNNFMMALQAAKSKPRIDSGIAFLAKNKIRKEVKVTASGLQYEILRDTAGPKPVATDSVTCHYKGTLLNGTVFDNSYDRGQPITFSLGGFIKGWTEGLQLMSVGSKYKFYIPYTLGYGPSDYGPIPGGSMLTFEVELLDIRKPADH
jgi:FKBP-type peptidyl-prolyl cis-trans isomerase FklB